MTATDASNVAILLIGLGFLAVMCWNSPAWFETLGDLFGRDKGK